MSQNGSTAALIAKTAAAAEASRGRGSRSQEWAEAEQERVVREWAAPGERLSLDFICVQKISISPSSRLLLLYACLLC